MKREIARIELSLFYFYRGRRPVGRTINYSVLTKTLTATFDVLWVRILSPSLKTDTAIYGIVFVIYYPYPSCDIFSFLCLVEDVAQLDRAFGIHIILYKGCCSNYTQTVVGSNPTIFYQVMWFNGRTPVSNNRRPGIRGPGSMFSFSFSKS